MVDYEVLLEQVLGDVSPYRGQGTVASYVPALAKADVRHAGIALMLGDGSVFSTGDAETPFSVQSISYVIALPLVLNHVKSALWNHVGREPAGVPLSSLAQLQLERGKPRNPLMNAGALVACDQFIGHRGVEAAADEFLDFVHLASGDQTIGIDESLAMSESRAGNLNRGIAYYLSAVGNLSNPVEDVLSLYYRQCSVVMTCRQLAATLLFLAFDGTDPRTSTEITTPSRARRTNALMLTAGHYDSSGEFAFRVGLPGKSSVSGAVVAVIPGVGVACAWSPGLNSGGCSLVGSLMLERLADRTGWSVFV
jgi:glutaminase